MPISAREKRSRMIKEAFQMQLIGDMTSQQSYTSYMARSLILTTMPHSDPRTNEFSRKNGPCSMVMLAPSLVGGVPYGPIPRIALLEMFKRVVLTKDPKIYLGDSFSDFHRQLGYTHSSGIRGKLPVFAEQLRRLLNSTISIHYDAKLANNRKIFYDMGIKLGMDALFMWKDTKQTELDLWRSHVTLSESFFKEVTEHAVPIKIEIAHYLKSSSLALDIYMWLTYRMDYLKQNQISQLDIPWDCLYYQFSFSDKIHMFDFKRAFLIQLKKVLSVYPVNLTIKSNSLLLKQNCPSIGRI